MALLSPACQAVAGRGVLPHRLRLRQGSVVSAAFRLYLLGCMSLLLSDAAAQSPRSEYEVKAAFLLNFMRFVNWPAGIFPEAGTPVKLCILGEDPFGPAIEAALESQTVNGRSIAVERLAAARGANACHVVFLDRTLPNQEQILRRIGASVLTVGETDQFLDDGGMIHFVIEGQRVRFDINARAANAAGLRLSSQLLGVARSVR